MPKLVGPNPPVPRDRYSNRQEDFKRPKNREDSSDLDENLTESIAAMKTIISKKKIWPFSPKNLAKTSRNRRRRGRWHARSAENPPHPAKDGRRMKLFCTPAVLVVI